MDSEFERQCKREGLMTLALLAQRYTREPSRRQEPRLEMDIADRLEQKRDTLTFCEFSAAWNRRQGQLP